MRSTHAYAAGLILAGLLLTGCSTTTDAPAATEPATPAAGAVEAPVTDAPAPLEVGVVLDRSPQDSELGPNQRVWNLDGGAAGWVVVDSTQPLPDVVKEDIVKPVVAKVATDEDFTYDSLGIIVGAKDEARFAERQTGRKIIVIVATYASADAVNYGTMYSALQKDYSDLGPASGSDSKDKTISVAQDWVASQPDASSWDIIDATAGR